MAGIKNCALIIAAMFLSACQTQTTPVYRSVHPTLTKPKTINSAEKNCDLKSITGEKYKLDESYKQYASLFFFFDPNKERSQQMDTSAYLSLISSDFKVVDTGVVTAIDISSRAEHLAEFRYYQEEYNGMLYSRDKSYSTKVVVNDCSVYYLGGSNTKKRLLSGILSADGNILSDAQLIQLIGTQGLSPLELKAKIMYDKFEKKYKVSTPVYNDILLRGAVDEAGRIVSIQLYTDLKFLDSWGFIQHALDEDGNNHEVTRISTESDCSDQILGCKLIETIGISFTKGFLEIKQSGFEIKAFGSKEKIIKVPGQLVQVFLEGLDIAMTKDSSAGRVLPR